MENQQNNNQQKDGNVKKGIKNTAGAVFHGAHQALETTENAAMNAVDGTANAINDIMGNENNKQKQNKESGKNSNYYGEKFSRIVEK